MNPLEPPPLSFRPIQLDHPLTSTIHLRTLLYILAANFFALGAFFLLLGLLLFFLVTSSPTSELALDIHEWFAEYWLVANLQVELRTSMICIVQLGLVGGCLVGVALVLITAAGCTKFCCTKRRSRRRR